MSDQLKRVVVCTQRAVSTDDVRNAIVEEATPLLLQALEGVPRDSYLIEVHQLGGSPSGEVIQQLKSAYAVAILYEMTAGTAQENIVTTTSRVVAGKVLANTKLERIDKRMGRRFIMLFREKQPL